jgi:hypothetical protein
MNKTVVSALILAAALLCSAASQTVDDAQKQAITKYPDLTRNGTPLNTKFLQLYREVQETDPGLLSNPNWPVILADEANDILKANPAPSASPPSASATPSPSPSAAPSAPQVSPLPSAQQPARNNQAGSAAVSPIATVNCSPLPGWLRLLFQALTALGTLAVAVIAIWQDQIIGRLNPIKGEIRRSNFEGKEEGTPQMTYHTYHVRAVATRPNRPLRGCAIVFRQVNRISNDGTVNGSIYPVWRQLPWAPVERTESKVIIATEQEADLGRYHLQKDLFEILFYRQGGEFDPYVHRGQCAKIFFHLRADNLLQDIASIVTVDMSGPTGTKPLISIE